MEGVPFRAPGGMLVPLLASVIMVWMLSTLEWKELLAASGLVVISGLIYVLLGRGMAGKVKT